MNESVEFEAPPPRQYTRRLTDEMKGFPVDDRRGMIMDRADAGCLVAYGRRKGWKMVQRNTQDGRICVWRTA